MLDNYSEKNNHLPVIAIIGKGNVGSHLALALKDKATIHLIDSHTLIGLPKDADLILLAVKDGAISRVASKITISSDTTILAHTAGSVPLSSLKDFALHYGVFYPLQTFTKGVETDYNEIAFFIEASDAETENRLISAARLISPVVSKADSEKRKKLHLASVFACNFTNALLGISQDLIGDDKEDSRFLKPLINQTIRKLEIMNAKEAQTGPAIREDDEIITAHLNLLGIESQEAHIYKSISDYIIASKHKTSDKL